MKVNECKLIQPISCNEDDYIMEVAQKLEKHKLRNIVVVNERNSPVGIISSVDIVNNIIAKGLDYTDILAKKIMVSPLFYATDNEKVVDAYLKMLKNNTYSLPVVNENKEFLGIVSFTEAVKKLTEKERSELNGI